MKGSNILITGGAGFIGSHLAERLVSLGGNVTVADNFSRGKQENIKHIERNIRLVRTDLRIESNCNRVTDGKDIVFNLAALNTGVDYDIGRSQTMFEENMLLQMMPLRAASKNGVKTFVQVSSASVYSTAAMVERIPTKESDEYDEPESSKSGYAYAKRMGERLAKWYGQNSRIRTVISRFINVYGSRDHFDGLGHFIPTIIRKFHTAATEIEAFGSGRQKRSFLHVDDAVEGLILLSQRGKNTESYNIDASDEHSVREVIEAISSVMHKEHIQVHYDEAKPEGSARRLLDAGKITRLGWKPTRSLLQSLPELVQDVTDRLSHDQA